MGTAHATLVRMARAVWKGAVSFGLVYIPIEGELTKKYALFKEEAGKITGITDISKMRNSPTAAICWITPGMA